uniref:RNA 2',3'-cyclic phosphodiesterase n=1 Tax=Ignisphaera aggregans TaxID=334771 RepID=A0A7C2VD61_9CREN
MSIRCFIAVEIEDPKTLSEVLKFKQRLESFNLDIKPVEDENVHLTIRFLGHISIPSVEIIKNKILPTVSQAINKFEIELRGIGAFPSINRPRVIWVGVTKGSEQLYSIRKIIDSEIVRNGLSDVHRDQHDFSPHITIARVKSSRNIHLFVELYKHYNDYTFGISPVTKIKLKQSILTPNGPIYRDLFSADLR